MLAWVMMPVKVTCQLTTNQRKVIDRMIKNLILNTPGLGHTVAGIVKVCGDEKLGEQLLQEANSNVNTLVNSIPVIGHAKGLVHFTLNDKEAGKEAMALATRSTAVLAAGTTGFLVAGPIGAVIARTRIGLAWDTGIHILSDGKTKPGVYQIVENPSDLWNYVDAFTSVLSDGVGCSSPGKMAENTFKNSPNSNLDKSNYTTSNDIEDEVTNPKLDYRIHDISSKLYIYELTF